MLPNLISQNLRISSSNAAVSNDAALLALATGTKVLDNTGKEFIKVDSNIFDLVDRDFITHSEFPASRMNQIAYKDEENTFTKTNNVRNLIPSSNNTYNLGSDAKKWNNVYGTKITINGVSVEQPSASNNTTSLYLPDVSSDYVHTLAQGNINGVGSENKAIYLDANGELKECTNILPDSDKIAYVDRENTFTENNNFENILPNENNTYDVGSNEKKWKKVYTNTLNLSGSDVTIESGTSTSSAVGNASTPVYIDANGIPRACNISSMISAAVASYITSGFLWDITKVGCLRLVLIPDAAVGVSPLIYKVGDTIDLNKIAVYQAGLIFQLNNDDKQYSFPNNYGGETGDLANFKNCRITSGTWKLLSPFYATGSTSVLDDTGGIGYARLCLIVRVA